MSNTDMDVPIMCHLPLILFAMLLSGCSSQVTNDTLKKEKVLISDSDYYRSSSLRGLFGEEWRNGQHPELGLALAGGGTKAADFSLGVINGLTESGLMQDIDIMSTVSGGGYAGYWYYSRLNQISPDVDVSMSVTSEANIFFADCLPATYAKALSEKDLPTTLDKCPDGNNFTNYTPPTQESPGNGDKYRYQNYLRGYQDIFSTGRNIFGVRAFNYERTGDDYSFMVDFPENLVLTLGSMALNIIPNVLFDWGVDISASKHAYEKGIARTYGANPPHCADGGCIKTLLNKEIRLEGDLDQARSLTFEDLERAHLKGGAPMWVINTTAGEDRSPWDFDDQQPIQLSVYEFTPYGSGSGLYGYKWYKFRQLYGATPFQAVVSSAAFFDSQQKVEFDPGWRNLVAFLMKGSTLSWGTSYRNPESSAKNFYAHLGLPWPFYYFHKFKPGRDQAFIHLSDGGMSENLGVYSLVRRGVTSIIVSDHAQDRVGSMADICRLKTQLADLGFTLQFPGLEGLAEHCREGDEAVRGYDIFNWAHPVLLGCIFKSSQGVEQKDNTCQGRPAKWNSESDPYFARVFLIKPALANHELSSAIKKVSQSCRRSGDRKEAISRKCQEAIKAECLAPQVKRDLETPWNYSGKHSCELLSFIMRNSFETGALKSDGCPHFPQYSTVTMTINSSPWIYGAMRELGAYYAQQIKWFFSSGKEVDTIRFDTAISYQAEDRNRLKLVPYDSYLWSKPKAGGSSKCLNLGREPELSSF